jgi:uncharacterized protein HemX
MSYIGLVAALTACCALAAPWTAGAQDRQLTPQQERMKSCNAQAGGKQMKGEERRDFMSQCLSGEGDRKLTAQQEKMVTCNRTASERKLKGDERQTYMSKCLSAKKETGGSAAATGR